MIHLFFAVFFGSTFSQCEQYYLANYDERSSCTFVTILTLYGDSTSQYHLLCIKDDITIVDSCSGHWKQELNHIEVMSEDYYRADLSTRQLLRAMNNTGEGICFPYRSYVCRNKTTLISPMYDGAFHKRIPIRLKTNEKKLLLRFICNQ